MKRGGVECIALKNTYFSNQENQEDAHMQPFLNKPFSSIYAAVY